MFSQKQLVLVTGANSGIGFEVVNQLLADGSFHVLLGARSEEKGQAALTDLRSHNLPGTVELLCLDVADEGSIAVAAKLVEKKHGRLDVLVNNAGIAGGKGTLADQMVECFRVSAVGAQLMGDYFSHLLKKSVGTPRIINVTSGAGSIGNHMNPVGNGNRAPIIPYRVSKAAMNMVFAVQHKAFEEYGFKVFLYGPGPTVSNLSPLNSGPGMKPTAVGAAPIVEMAQGKRDEDAGKYLEYGFPGSFPW
ncbi:NAD(P)-binding protein [Xylaria cf. heliscus]|nr:NAD(P)-binding protein [Xylaria cf. heliscus]